MAESSAECHPESLPTQESTADQKELSPQSPSLPTLTTFGREFRLTCLICLQDLKKPKQLKACYHIFCSDCLKTFIETAQDGQINCPACQTRCPVEDISKAMNSDSYLHALQGQVCLCAESGNIYCSDCSVLARYFCLECGKNFCETCHVDVHNANEDFSTHHCLKLFKAMATMTVGMNRRESGFGARSDDEVDHVGATSYQCPVCRNLDQCDHQLWLKDLQKDDFRTNNVCKIPEHKDGNKLIGFCKHCQKPICRNCSVLEHKDHETVNISTAMGDKEPELRAMKKELTFQQDIFNEAAKRANMAEVLFKTHVHHVEEEMIERKGKIQVQVEEAFNIAYGLIEQTGQKQAELNRQSVEMKQENNFLRDAIALADIALRDNPDPLECIRIWMGLNFICSGLRGEDDKRSAEPQMVLPQEIVEKKLVLPASNCMDPDLRILQKVGIEGKVLRKAFVLQAEDELYLFYSILPLTETEALVSCKTDSYITSLVQYSNMTDKRHKVTLKEDGQYCFIAVPGNGIVATLYQTPRTGLPQNSEGKKQILFWDQALDRSLKVHEAEGVGDKLKMFAETPLPPRGVTVTKDNHLVVLTAKDPGDAGGESGSACITIMTMRGDVLRSKILHPAVSGSQSDNYFPRYVTVNINRDICVTDEKDRSVIIFNSNLEEQYRIRSPYTKPEMNKNFSPMGICHDSFGRLIVADNYNQCVVRFEVDAFVHGEPAEIILKDGINGVQDLNYPTMVALGPGPKLWVVCRTNIQVFDYMDKE